MNFCHRYRLGGALAVLVTIATHGPLSAQTALYTVIDLNLKTEERTNFARTINLFGQVVGRSAAINGASTRAMLWSLGGGVTTLGVLPDGDYSAAFGINESGEVVGTSNTATTTRAFHWAGADLRALDLLPGDVSSEAFAINNHGDVVGYSSGPQGIRAILWKNATAPQIFGTLPGGDFSMAYGKSARQTRCFVERFGPYPGTRDAPWRHRKRCRCRQ
jgi:probable HAF family extracellular repeat protein